MRHYRRGAAFGALVALGLLGCSQADLEVVKMDDTTSKTPQTSTLIYYLPRTRVDITATVTLKSCGYSAKTKQNEFVADATYTATPTVEADPNYRYAIAYGAMESWQKEVNFTLSLNANKTLASFNGQVNDQIGPTAVAVISTAVQIAGAAMVGSVPVVGTSGRYSNYLVNGVTVKQLTSAPPPPALPPPLCNPDVVAAFILIAAQNTIIDNAKKKIPATPTDLTVQTNTIAAAQTEIANLTKKYKLTRSALYHWKPERNGIAAGADSAWQSDIKPILANWLLPDAYKRMAASHPDKCGIGPAPADDVNGCVFGKASVPATFEIILDQPTVGSDLTGAAATTPGGLVVRDPALGRLEVCENLCTLDNAAGLTDITGEVLARQNVVMPQFGQIRVYPEKSHLFENATLVVQTNADGSIASAQYHSTSTAAAGATGLGTAAGNYESAETARNNANTAINTATTNQAQLPDTINKAMADCYTQQGLVKAAGGTPVPCQ